MIDHGLADNPLRDIILRKQLKPYATRLRKVDYGTHYPHRTLPQYRHLGAH
ncbi:Uncharacterised protein [Serratia fonticola]|nr:Uncharacterised protein [Serratia fonticola]